MNATGKSRFGKRLASKLGLKRIDTDTVLKKELGDLKSFIAKEGVEAFREKEMQLVLSSLEKGSLIVLSGGAIESHKVRAALKERSATIWIQAGLTKVTRNIEKAKRERHEFAEGSPSKIAAELLAQRNPLYQEVASITIHEGVRYQQFLPIAIAELRKYYSADSSG